MSSVGQAKDGNSIEAQTAALLERGCEEIYSEAYTGTTTDRPEFLKILGKIEKGDTLMVTKLDRFSRTAAEGVALIQELHEKGIVIEILNMGRADNTPMGKLMVTMLLAFAEFEHDQIIERLATGKAVARTHGKKRPMDDTKSVRLGLSGIMRFNKREKFLLKEPVRSLEYVNPHGTHE